MKHGNSQACHDISFQMIHSLENEYSPPSMLYARSDYGNGREWRELRGEQASLVICRAFRTMMLYRRTACSELRSCSGIRESAVRDGSASKEDDAGDAAQVLLFLKNAGTQSKEQEQEQEHDSFDSKDTDCPLSCVLWMGAVERHAQYGSGHGLCLRGVSVRRLRGAEAERSFYGRSYSRCCRLCACAPRQCNTARTGRRGGGRGGALGRRGKLPASSVSVRKAAAVLHQLGTGHDGAHSPRHHHCQRRSLRSTHCHFTPRGGRGAGQKQRLQHRCHSVQCGA
mmetsp:Transcript_35289/g.51742  ORF Transcript_35289/g.51742 Transcript_35289/m.51742 type:complete len:283 (+) Transcript_35289:231-1079(+)